jgi:AcrR family transcriptional regulator
MSKTAPTRSPGTLRGVPKPDVPAPRLTRATVLDEAMSVLDEEGLDALTMRHLAERLGVVPMAIYRHVSNKDDLIDALLDLAVSQVPLPDPALDWRTGLRALAVAMRGTMLSHPGVVAPLVTRPSLGAHALAIGEYGLAVMREAGFGAEDAQRGPNAVLTYTIGFVALEVPRRRAGFAADGSAAPGLDVPFESLDDGTFPHTKAIRPLTAELVSDAQFSYGLERVLDGIAGTAPLTSR